VAREALTKLVPANPAVPAVLKTVLVNPDTSQSPAVRDIEVIFVLTSVTSDTADDGGINDEIYSPTYPAAALSFVVVPTIPPVVGLNVIDDVMNAGSVVLHDGAPDPSVMRILLSAVVNPDTALPFVGYQASSFIKP
jgi:hypothetical protein